jgi:hypothetical protein
VPAPAYQQTSPQNSHDPNLGSDSGPYEGIPYTIRHRDINAVVDFNIPSGSMIKAKAGVMLHMTPSIHLRGAIKFSLKKLLTDSQILWATFTGPGTVTLAPRLMGDVITLALDTDTDNGEEGGEDGEDGEKWSKKSGKRGKKGGEKGGGGRPWRVGKEHFLVCTEGVDKDTKA